MDIRTLRGIRITVHSRHAYHVSDPYITILNPRKRFNWGFEYRFITNASKIRLFRLMGLCDPIAAIHCDPLGDQWYCTNTDSSTIYFVWS